MYTVSLFQRCPSLANLDNRRVYTTSRLASSLLASMAISLLDALYIPFTSALLGVLFLTSISPLEFERYMFHYLTFYTFIFLGRVCVYGFGPGRSFVTAFAQTSLVALSFNVSLFVSIAVYRLFGHRCRKFPGPVLARLTRFYVAYLNAKGYQFYKELGELHERYGDIVRTGKSNVRRYCMLLTLPRASRNQYSRQSSHPSDLWAEHRM